MNNKERAMLVAERAHANQSYDIYPYIYHIKKVKSIAETLGYDESIIISCILHDILEDTDLSYNDIKTAFGEEVAEIVYCVTDELGRNREERKLKTYPKIKGNWKAVVVKVCDRIANILHSVEHSNTKMVNVYRKEHQNFKESLMSETHPYEVNRAWAELDKKVLPYI